MDDMIVIKIQKDLTYDLIKKNHYLHRLPNVVYSYGLYKQNILLGICTFGIPASLHLCEGLCGKDYKDYVIELNRLFLIKNEKNLASFFVSRCLKMLPKPKIVVSYADKNNGHCGYIYQATNFLYTGLSAKRTNPKNSHGLHSRTVWKQNQETIERPRKHRYVYMVGGKSDRKKLLKNLKYKVQDYPKSENVNYNVGNIPPSQILLL